MSSWLIHTMCEIRYFPQCSAKYGTRIKATIMHACTWTKYKLQNRFGNQICDPTTHHAQQLDTRNKLNCLRLNLCLPPLRSEPQCQIVDLMVSHPNLLPGPNLMQKNASTSNHIAQWLAAVTGKHRTGIFWPSAQEIQEIHRNTATSNICSKCDTGSLH